MKKMIALAILLLVLSITGMTVIGVAVSTNNDNVTITERTLYGDKSAAEGITINSVSHYDEHLLWNTDYTVGGQPQTEYSFHASEMRNGYINHNYHIMLDVDISYGCEFNVPAEKQHGLARAYKELFDEAEPGVEAKRIVNLKDFYEYYPVRVVINLPGVFWSGNDYDALVEDHEGSEKYVLRAFNEFFRIPMLAHEIREISVTKGANGQHIGMGSSTVGSEETYFFDTDSVVTDDTCYFTINNRTTSGELIDTSLIPGGYGIYSFQYTESSNMYTGGSIPGVTGVNAGSLDMVYKLDDEVIVNNLLLSEDHSKLLMITVEGGSTWFSVIDISSMKLLQKFEIEDFNWSSYNLHDHGSFYVLMNWDKFALVAMEEDGSYAYKFSSPTAYGINEEFQYVNTASAMNYNGEKLVIVNSIYEEQHRALDLCSFYIAVYDARGLLYYGEYDSSLSVNPDAYNYNYNCLPYYNRYAYTVDWK